MSENIFNFPFAQTTLDFSANLTQEEIKALENYNPSAFAFEDEEIEILGNLNVGY